MVERGSREAFAQEIKDRHPSVAALIKYFAWSHLPLTLQFVSAPFGELAVDLLHRVPDGPELTAALRKLVEAKDCAVRAALDAQD